MFKNANVACANNKYLATVTESKTQGTRRKQVATDLRQAALSEEEKRKEVKMGKNVGRGNAKAKKGLEEMERKMQRKKEGKGVTRGECETGNE